MRTRTGTWGGGLVAIAASLALCVACGGADGGGADATGGGGFDGSVLVPLDVPSPGGQDVDAKAPPDTHADTPEAQDVATVDVPPSDTPSPDVSEPDVPPPADVVESCDDCPAERPDCLDGLCVCTPTSCGVGRFCNDGVCQACTIDERCGDDCADCTLTGGACAPDGRACVECDPNDATPCPAGEYCAAGDCVPCDTGAACGADCAPCPADQPSCVGGVCGCEEGACPAGSWCFQDRCEPCDSALACGEQCLDCRDVGTPRCVDGECRCDSDEHCPAGSWCDGGACVDCGDDDALHCGDACAVCEGATPVCVGGLCACSVDADCGNAARCEGGGCLPCDDGDHCGADCAPCPEQLPFCDGGTCVACVADEDCGTGSWCDAGACQRCRDSDPDHCGTACVQCGGETAACVGGQCVCDETSCPDYESCTDGVCTRCDDDDRCGVDCAPCGAGAPHCALDGSRCVECLTGADCTAPDVCRDDLTCGPACEAPACEADLSPHGEDCPNAKVIGRLGATQTAFLSGDTEGDGNDDDDPEWFGPSECWDANADNFYRMYLIAGDRIDVVLAPQVYEFDSMMKLYHGTDCRANGDEDFVACYQTGGAGEEDTFSWTADTDGWVTIVVDGRRSGDPHYGPYVLRVTLTCATPNCCCP